jgi:hypothetical protein
MAVRPLTCSRWIRLVRSGGVFRRSIGPDPPTWKLDSAGSALPPSGLRGDVPEIEPRAICSALHLAARLVGGWVMFQADDLATVAAYPPSARLRVLFAPRSH